MIINKMDSYKTDSIVKTIRHSLCSGHEAGPSDEYLRSNIADGRLTEKPSHQRRNRRPPLPPSFFYSYPKRREKTDANGGRQSFGGATRKKTRRVGLWRPHPLHPRCSSSASVRGPVGARNEGREAARKTGNGDRRGSRRGTPGDVNYAACRRTFFFYASRFFYD